MNLYLANPKLTALPQGGSTLNHSYTLCSIIKMKYLANKLF